MSEHYVLNLDGVSLRCSFQFPETPGFFGKWCHGPFPGTGNVFVTEDYWAGWQREIGPKNAQSEYSAFASFASVSLMPCQRCLFHGVAFRWKDGAYLLSAPSGVGKSTIYKALEDSDGDMFSVISGDRPLLSFLADGSIQVCPTPWNGKEGWHGAASAPLRSVILLRRGEQNAAVRLSDRDAAARLYASFIQTAEDGDEMRLVAGFASKVLRTVPVWDLCDHDIPGAVKVLLEDILQGGVQT